MKRIFIATLVFSLFFSITSVKAMSEADLQKKLTQNFTVAGQKVGIPSDTKVMVERYLKENEVSSKDADYIAAKVDEAIAILKEEGKTDFSKLSVSTKNKLKALVSDISKNTSVKATVTKNSLVIYNPDGTVFAEVTHLVKQTGKETSQIIIVGCVAFIVVTAGAYLVVRRVKTSK